MSKYGVFEELEQQEWTAAGENRVAAIYGIQPIGDRKLRAHARAVLQPAVDLFKEEIKKSNVLLIFVYDNLSGDEAKDNKTAYELYRFHRNDKPLTAAGICSGGFDKQIGISLQAFSKSDETAVSVFIHELSHVVRERERPRDERSFLSDSKRDHDEKWKAIYNELLGRYNEEYDTDIQPS